MRKNFIAFFCSLIILLCLTGCKNDKNSPENQTIKYNLDNEPRTLDPQICSDPAANTVVINIFEGLVRLDADGNIIPGVALKWETSSDGLMYKFYLRQNACWSDENKTPVTAYDFIFGLQRAINKSTNSPKANHLFCIKNARDININGKNPQSLGVTALDNYTLEITLEEPNENFLYDLTDTIAMPCNKAFFEDSNGQYGLESSKILGNGAFKIKKRYGWDHYNSINLVKNVNYFGENKPIPAGITFSIGKDISDTIDLFKKKDLDAAFLPYEQTDRAIEEQLQINSIEDTLWGLTFNSTNKIFSNQNIRLAFIKALDREKILSSIPNRCEVANDILSLNFIFNLQNFRNVAGSNLYLKEDAQAKNYLESGMKQANLRALPTVSIACLDTPNTKDMVSNIIENLNSKLGYYFNMEAMPKNILFSRVKTTNYQIAFVPIIAETNYIYDFLNTFQSDNKNNVSNLNDPEYDNMLNKAILNKSSDMINYLTKAEKYLNDNAIFYPLYKQNSYFACSKKISNIIINKYNKAVDFMLAKKLK